MTLGSGYEIVVGVRLIPTRAPAYANGNTKLPWSEAPGKKDKRYSSVLVTESYRMPSQRQAVQGYLKVVQPFDSPSTLRQACPERRSAYGRRAQDSADLRRCPEVPPKNNNDEGFTEGTRLRIPPVKPFEPEMVLIPAGEFTMGSDPRLDQDVVDGGQPQRTLYLPDYYLAKKPVTNAQYAAFVQATGHHLPERWTGGQPPTGKEDHPVVYVSWHDAMAYCHWLAKETSQPYRLPSEAEWEKGARGSDGRIHRWGSQGDEKRYGAVGSKRGATPVGDYAQGAIPYDLPDMAGNVWEWTQSVCEVYPCDPENGREGIKSGVGRVLRGGSWFRNQWYARCTLRYGISPVARYHYLGFRVAASPGSR